jgi:hypothetical protein
VEIRSPIESAGACSKRPWGSLFVSGYSGPWAGAGVCLTFMPEYFYNRLLQALLTSHFREKQCPEYLVDPVHVAGSS